MEYQSYYTLANGVKIPSIGFGTWQAEADVSFLTGLSGCAGDAPDPDQMPF